MRRERDTYQAWLVGEIVLFALLGGSLAFFVTHTELPSSYALPNLRLTLETAGTLATGLVAILAGTRFATDGRRFDLLLCLGFCVASASTLAFALAPRIAEQELTRAEAWSLVAAGLMASTLIAAAPFARGTVASHRRTLGNWLAFLVVALAALWLLVRSIDALPALVPGTVDEPPALLTTAYSAAALLNLVAVVGFGLRFRERRDDLDRWLALGTTLMLFSSLHLVFTPLLGA